MAEKKYIGKPGKQDDPCWKGYEMVGMKKKNGKSVPNCVPEATDIIERAKKIAITKARGKKDWTGAQAPKDQFLMPEENDLEEAVQSNNPTYGYHGTVAAKDDADRAKKFSSMHAKVKKMVAPHLQDAKKPNVMVRHFLDSQHGRHIADDPSEHNIKSRFKNFAKKYDPAMHEEVELDEAVEVSHDRYVRTHGKKARGAGSFMFTHKRYGDAKGDDVHTVNHAKSFADAAKSAKQWAKSKGHSAVYVMEELGKDNEWGRPELRKKYAAMTPGQESMTADQIPSFDPRYDDVTTQYCGGLKEGFLAEISARGAVARAKFQARVQKVLSDPASIKRAKKQVAKQKAAAKEKEAPHLVMQLRKAVSIGSKVHFQDGSHHQIAPNHADMFMSKYNSAKSSIEKEALQKRAHKSHSEFMKAISEEIETPQGNGPEHESHMGNGGHIGTVEVSHEDIRFGDVDSEELYSEIEKEVDDLKWEDIVDLYDPEELEYESDEEDEDEEECGCGEMSEAITPQGRLKKKFAAMRTKTRRNMARNLALKRVSTPDRIKSRSVRAARRMVYKRLLRNRDISTVSAAEKTRIEAQIKRMAPMVARLSVRVMPQVRKLEQSRIKRGRTKKK